MSSSSEAPWSILNWQCGQGVVQECTDQVLNWDEPKSFLALMDQIMPLFDIGYALVGQFLYDQVGEGALKAVNSLRCMQNSAISSQWAIWAGTWQFIKVVGQDALLKPYMDQGYGYVCTCLIDLNGIKASLGISAKSSSTFSSCSEHAQYEKIKARQAQERTKASRQSAAESSLLDAARKLKAYQTVNVLKRKANCNTAAGSTHPTEPTPAVGKDKKYDTSKAEYDYNTGTHWVTTNLAGCEADVLTLEQEAKLIHYYWLVKVWSSGGLGSHRNKEEQTNLLEAEWILEGIANFKNIIYPNATKYDQWGHEITCTAGNGSTACQTEMNNYYAARQNPPNNFPNPVQGFFYAHHSNIQCAPNNDGTASPLTTYTVEATNNESEACALVPLKYSYYQWQHNGSITCGAGAQAKTGFKYCKFNLTTEAWELRSTAPSDAQSATDDFYRTLGSKVASITTTTAADGTTSPTTVEGSVRDQDIKCYYYDGSAHTIAQGTANCFPVKIESSSIRIGTQSGSAALAINESYYQWIYGSSASCAAGSGLTNCTPTLTWNSACTVSAVNKLRFNTGTTTICTTADPTITWANISS